MNAPRTVKVTALLADHAEVAAGKLFINGGGWTWTGPEAVPFAIALIIELPAEAAGVAHSLRLELIDPDGHAVRRPDAQPVALEAGFSVTPGAGTPRGTPITIPLAFNCAALPIPPGGRYEWRIEIDGETCEDWRLGFNTRPVLCAE